MYGCVYSSHHSTNSLIYPTAYGHLAHFYLLLFDSCTGSATSTITLYFWYFHRRRSRITCGHNFFRSTAWSSSSYLHVHEYICDAHAHSMSVWWLDVNITLTNQAQYRVNWASAATTISGHLRSSSWTHRWFWVQVMASTPNRQTLNCDIIYSSIRKKLGNVMFSLIHPIPDPIIHVYIFHSRRCRVLRCLVSSVSLYCCTNIISNEP